MAAGKSDNKPVAWPNMLYARQRSSVYIDTSSPRKTKVSSRIRSAFLLSIMIAIGLQNNAVRGQSSELLQPSLAELESIVSSWNVKQYRHGNARWEYSGETIYPQGAITSNPDYQAHLPQDIDTEIPPQDHISDLQLNLIMDFDGNRARRRFRRDTFYISQAKFIPDVEIDICDGKTYTNVAPREDNTSESFAPGKYQPDVDILGSKAPLLFFRPIDLPVLMAHGIFPCAATPLVPTQFRSPHKASTFKFVSNTALGDDRIVVISIDLSAQPGQMSSEIWVNLDQDMLPIRVINKRGVQEVGRFEISNTKTAIGWRPNEWTFRELMLDSRTLKIERVKVDRVDYDTAIAPDEFSVTIVPGMVVQDRINKTWYVKGNSTNPDISVEELKALASLQDKPMSKFRLVGIVASSVAIIGFSMALAHKRFRRTKEVPV